jgi:putative FmdB family regulatory protein
MPTYEYRCDKCGEHHEVVQSFRDDPLTQCPACGGRLRKVFGSIGVVFKGSGFYKTDSRASSKADAKGKDADGKAKEKKAPAESSSGASESSGSDKKSDKSDSAPSSLSSGTGSSTGSAAAAS